MKVTVIGLGYVGTVAAAGFASVGHDVLAVDIDRVRVQELKSGSLPLYEPGLDKLMVSSVNSDKLRFMHCDDVDESLGDVALIATGTPQSAGGAVDLRQVRSALSWVVDECESDALIVMKSTVPPGTGGKLISQELKGNSVGYVSNPEFLREGHAVADWKSPDRIVIGVTKEDKYAVELVREMYRGIEAPYLVTDVTSAEMIKYASNAFLATRISFINEIAALCEHMGASIDAVSDGLAMDSRSGARIYSGLGYGGSCFPKDVRALDHLALSSGLNMDLLKAVMSVNNRQRLLPLHALRRRFNGRMSGLKVGILGISFKPGTDDVRDAPSLDLIASLLDEGARVKAFDPRAIGSAQDELPSSVGLVDCPLDVADDAHAVILVTEWEEIVNADWAEIYRRMNRPHLLFDGRNVLDAFEMKSLGFDYVGVGRR